MKTVLLTLSMMLTAVTTFAADATTPSERFWADPFNSPLMPIVIVTAFLFIAIVLVAFVAIYLVRVLNLLAEEAARENARSLGVVYVPKPTWWDKLTQTLNDSVPVTEEKNIELDHAYDGIKELDNHLPPWWKWLFYATIGWSAVYVFVFHFSMTLPLSTEEYQNEVAFAEEQSRKLKASQPQAAIDENTLAYTEDEAVIAKGKEVFQSNNCGSCHGADGGGNTIGPNLADAYWLHGGSIKNLYLTIKDGVVEKGMPAWGKTMSARDVRDVAFYVMSLQGSTPANPKAPQGELYQQDLQVKSDSTAQASL